MSDATALVPRFSAERVATALKDTPVVLVNGPRQCGKTTLVRELIAGKREYVTLDDATTLAGARDDPAGFVRNLDRAVIDEVQRAPDLLRAIKQSVDDDRRPGRFLLTGSTSVFTLPRFAESLAGRMEVVTLLPLSRAELVNRKSKFLEQAFAGRLVKPAELLLGGNLVRAALTGGYPEMHTRATPERRQAWARDYLRAVTQRDARDVAELERLDQMPRLLRALAHHASQLVNFSQLGGQIGMDDKTTRKYVGIVEQLFLARRIEPWFRNRLKRLVKTPKLHFLDPGLLAALTGATEERVSKNRSMFGALLETFVFSEIEKQIAWSDQAPTLHFYRDKDQDEVDFVIENDQGEIVATEVKAAATVTAADFKGLRKLADACAGDFKLGIVVYDGASIVPFGERMFAAPVACLWA